MSSQEIQYRTAPAGAYLKGEIWDIYGIPFATFFWSKVAVTANPDKCWEWQRTVLPKTGYGQVQVNSKRYSTHRLAWQVTNKCEPKGDILHLCDNKKCVNPSHLRDGSKSMNMQDKLLCRQCRLHPIGE